LAATQNKNMKTLLVIFAGLAMAGAAFAQVDPTRPMVTGRGNVSARPDQVIVTNQTTPAAPTTKTEDTVQLEKFQVTGSLMPHAATAPAPKK
jgi:hypothetical protein